MGVHINSAHPCDINDTFIHPRQKHKQHSSTIYKKYEKKKEKN